MSTWPEKAILVFVNWHSALFSFMFSFEPCPTSLLNFTPWLPIASLCDSHELHTIISSAIHSPSSKHSRGVMSFFKYFTADKETKRKKLPALALLSKGCSGCGHETRLVIKLTVPISNHYQGQVWKHFNLDWIMELIFHHRLLEMFFLQCFFECLEINAGVGTTNAILG